jgi:hypothetical protein
MTEEEDDGPRLVGTIQCKTCLKVGVVRSDGSASCPCEHLEPEISKIKKTMRGIPGLRILCCNPSCMNSDGYTVMVQKSYNKSQYNCPNCGMIVMANMEDGK